MNRKSPLAPRRVRGGGRGGMWMERMKRGAQRLAGVVLLLLLWQAAAEYGPWPHHLFPTPWEVAKGFYGLLSDGQLLTAAGHSLKRLGKGYLISSLMGL